MKTTFDIVHENLLSSFQKQKRYHDVRLKPREFQTDSLVWRWYPPKAHQKLGYSWTGPYRIIRKFSGITYEIQHEVSQKILVVHVDHLKQCTGDGTSENQYDSNDDTDDYVAPESTIDNESNDSDTDNMSVNSENEPMIKPSSASPSREITFSRKGRLIKPVSRYSP